MGASRIPTITLATGSTTSDSEAAGGSGEISDDDDVAETIPEVCAAAKCCRSSVYKAISAGDLVARKLFGKTIVLRGDRRRWLRALRTITPAAAD
jgi:hypothetical protein